MQVERSYCISKPQGREIRFDSGKRVSNTWIIYLRAWDNIPKGVLIPHKTTILHGIEVKGGDRKAYHLKMSPRSISLLVG